MVMVKKKKMMRVKVTMPSYFEQLQSFTVNVCFAHMLVFCHSTDNCCLCARRGTADLCYAAVLQPPLPAPGRAGTTCSTGSKAPDTQRKKKHRCMERNAGRVCVRNKEVKINGRAS